MNPTISLRNDWTLQEIDHLFSLPLMDLLFQAQSVHRDTFPKNTVQLSTLISLKTGACSEDCAYCPQSGRYQTSIQKHRLLGTETVKVTALAAKANGATRFCMGAAWRSPPQHVFEQLLLILKVVKDIGLETCMTLGMLTANQAQQLSNGGLDYYNHNLDTSPEYYTNIITTHTYVDRLETIEHVRTAGIKVCCGGIIGLGESKEDRVSFLQQLANLPEHPKSVPINKLIPIKGTPLGKTPTIDSFEFVRVIATARILMPKSVIRLSAGREDMNDEFQALCFLAGVNSIFYGEKLLTAKNPALEQDRNFLKRLGIQAST
ncbi:MAG TPA: biotin synthase BioB [Gammaproteobacteria bacterium]|nr:biotin synthase BioB [Gammaproteobacteria bacterium]HQZ87746.1 biotin synthase BioB [Gammaproteobacteria bacterium]HRA42393.1 biotin synthase BioB [Gammaproteobacteria bacterium]